MSGVRRLLPITRAELFDIESAKPADKHAAQQIEDLCWRTDQGRTQVFAAYRLRRRFSRGQLPQHLHLPYTYGEPRRDKQFRISLIYWWKGRDSNPRPRHYEHAAPLKIGLKFNNLPQAARCDGHDEAQPSTTDSRKSPAMHQCICHHALPSATASALRR